MGTWAVAACSTVIFMSLYKSEDFAKRLNFKIAPQLDFQMIAVIGIIVNFLFCYIWEVRPNSVSAKHKLSFFRFIFSIVFCSKKFCPGTRKKSGAPTWSLNTWRGSCPIAQFGRHWGRTMI